jgi:hypothetical protein
MKKIEEILSNYRHTIEFLSIIVALIVGFLIFGNYVNNQIENKINDGDYIEYLSKSLRPFCVFNETGIIEYDHGAEKFIKSISINKNEDTITIEFNDFLQNAPLLITVGAYQYSYEAIKKNNRIFVYNLSAPELMEEEGEKEVAENKYILEILKN